MVLEIGGDWRGVDPPRKPRLEAYTVSVTTLDRIVLHGLSGIQAHMSESSKDNITAELFQ